MQEPMISPESTQTASGKTSSLHPARRGARRWGLGWFLVLLLLGNLDCAEADRERNDRGTQAAVCPASGDPELIDLLKPIRHRSDVPAMAAAIVTSEGLQAVAVAGVRKRDSEVAATLTDTWHLGSNTKAMTAMLAAKRVDEDRLRWDSSVGEIFPELADALHPDARGIKLLQLLSHRAGIPANLELGSYAGSEVRALRLRAVRDELAQAPRTPPGAEYQYSNLGYILAGAMIERVTDTTWEDGLQADLLSRLGMRSAGFGGMGTEGKIDQPWGHRDNGRPVHANGPAVDNPPVMGPAGRVHCTIQDWALFIADQLRGARGQPALFPAAAYTTVQSPPFGGDYGLGWMVLDRDWGGGNVLHHAGSNTMNYSNAWVAPTKDVAFLVCINQGGDTAFKASDQAVAAMIALHNARLAPME